MCGIFGIVRCKGSTFNTKLLRLVLKKLAIESKIRGRDATGYAFMQKDGINIFKHNVHADSFISLKNYKQVIRDNMPGTGGFGYPYAVIGHTRAQTLGTHMNPDNNHPLRVGSIVGVHNGMISNHREIFKWLDNASEGKTKRIAQVDSEAIFALTNYMSKVLKWPAKHADEKVIGHVGDPTSQAIAKAAGRLRGSFACAALDADNPKNVWLFRGAGQLAVNYYREEKLLIFASVEHFINTSVKLFNLSDPDTLSIDMDTGLCIDAEKGTYNLFDLDIAPTVTRNNYMC